MKIKEAKTYSAKPTDVERKWYIIDAAEAPLGRISTLIATTLTGKNKPMFTSHIDCGDFVVVVNADNLVVTGEKLTDKMYYRHSGYVGNLKEATLAQKQIKKSGEAIRLSVKGMLPKNKLVDERLKRLKIYAGMEHKHAPQAPIALSTLKPKKVSK
jgi:large subunit ribosomal protein L13